MRPTSPRIRAGRLALAALAWVLLGTPGAASACGTTAGRGREASCGCCGPAGTGAAGPSAALGRAVADDMLGCRGAGAGDCSCRPGAPADEPAPARAAAGGTDPGRARPVGWIRAAASPAAPIARVTPAGIPPGPVPLYLRDARLLI